MEKSLDKNQDFLEKRVPLLKLVIFEPFECFLKKKPKIKIRWNKREFRSDTGSK